MDLTTLLVIAGILGLIPAFIAEGKGHSLAAWWLFGTLLFIVALPCAIFLPPNAEVMEERGLRLGGRVCPYCKEVIKAGAVVCRFCGRESEPDALDKPEPESGAASLMKLPTTGSKQARRPVSAALLFGAAVVIAAAIRLTEEWVM